MTKKEVMRLAWTLKKLDNRNLFSECLKLAWQVSKSDDLAAQLETLGFKRWTKGTEDRMYVNCEILGVDLENLTFNGEEISKYEAKEYKFQKVYFDLYDNRIYRDKRSAQGRELACKAKEIIDAITGNRTLFNI